MSERIDAAIREELSEMDDHDDGDLLVEWMLITYVVNPDEDKPEGYPILFSNDYIPDHHARGLLAQAQARFDDLKSSD